MRREEAIVRLREIELAIRAFGVRGLYLFGSVARDEAGDASDIDILVEPVAASFFELRNYMGAYERLTAAFPGFGIGYTTREGLSRHVRPEVEREAIRIF